MLSDDSIYSIIKPVFFGIVPEHRIRKASHALYECVVEHLRNGCFSIDGNQIEPYVVKLTREAWFDKVYRVRNEINDLIYYELFYDYSRRNVFHVSDVEIITGIICD